MREDATGFDAMIDQATLERVGQKIAMQAADEATRAERKRCVSVLVVAARRQRRLARELWHKHRDRYRHKKEAQLLMQAAREIMPKKGN